MSGSHRLFVSLFAVSAGVLVLLAPLSTAIAAATATKSTLVKSVRVGRTTFDYSFTVTVANTTPALANAVATVSSSAPTAIVIKSIVNLGSISANSVMTGADTYTLQVNRAYPFDPSKISIVVTGTALASVPDVVGETQAAAEIALSGADLLLGSVTKASSDTVSAGDVISQSPAAGGLLAAGSAVDLVISTGPAPDFSQAEMYSNVASPQILSFNQGTSTYTYLGARNAQGTPQSITGLEVSTPGQSITNGSFDSAGRPLAAHLSDGTDLTFKWLSATKAVVTAVTADGAHQANVAIDTSSPAPAAAQVPAAKGSAVLNNFSLPTRQRHPATRTIKPAAPQLMKSSAAAAASDLPNGEVDVLVSANSQPVSGADVYATVVPRASPGSLGYTIPLTETTPGKYAGGFVNFPGTIDTDTVISGCENVLSLITQMCSVGEPVSNYMVQQGCLLISAALVETGGIEILVPCEGFFKSVASGCNVVNKAPEGAPEGICSNLVSIIDEFDPDGESITATASKGGVSGTATNEFPGSTAIAELSINLPLSACQITSFATDPADPGGGGDYVATSATTCTGTADTISMHDVGTDGYVQDQQCTGVADCSMTIPDGAPGIVDTLTVTTSSAATRTISLVFN